MMPRGSVSRSAASHGTIAEFARKKLRGGFTRTIIREVWWISQGCAILSPMGTKIDDSRFAYIYISRPIYAQIREIAEFENRTIRAQTEILLLAGLKTAARSRKVSEEARRQLAVSGTNPAATSPS